MSDKISVSTRKGLFDIARSPHGYRVVETAFLGDSVSLTLPASDGGTSYAALTHGHFGSKLHRRKPGADWEPAAAPKFPERPEGTPPEQTPDGRNLPWNVEQIWALEHAAPGTLWCGTIPGGLFVSRDAGESWELVESLWNHPGRKEWFGGGADFPGIHSICVDPRSTKTVRVAVSCGGVWQTDDDGLTWRNVAHGMRAEFMPPERVMDPNIQDAHRVVQCAAVPDVLWCQHHNGIFKSSDASQSWQEILTAQPTSFGFGVVVHPKDPDRAWFVPAIKDEKRIPKDGKLVVSHTRDGGKTFEVLSQGLPQEHAYDLVYRHALAIDESGDRLAFGSTTGGLWISENGGQSFQQLEARLPPIHAVRFY
jgi:photosystem II stability/assembly factor-like uncharacterized protein